MCLSGTIDAGVEMHLASNAFARTSRSWQVDDRDGPRQGGDHVRVETVVLHHQDYVDLESLNRMGQQLQT